MTQEYDSEYGVLDRAQERPTLRFSRRLAHPPEKVWRALTEPEHLAAWFPTTIDGDLVAGAKLSFSFRDMDIPALDGEMLACEPPSLLELTWSDERLRFELMPDGDGTLLRFTAPWDSGERWGQVHPGYVQRFGPEASTIGPPQEWKDAHDPAQ